MSESDLPEQAQTPSLAACFADGKWMLEIAWAHSPGVPAHRHEFRDYSTLPDLFVHAWYDFPGKLVIVKPLPEGLATCYVCGMPENHDHPEFHQTEGFKILLTLGEGDDKIEFLSVEMGMDSDMERIIERLGDESLISPWDAEVVESLG